MLETVLSVEIRRTRPSPQSNILRNIVQLYPEMKFVESE